MSLQLSADIISGISLFTRGDALVNALEKAQSKPQLGDSVV